MTALNKGNEITNDDIVILNEVIQQNEWSVQVIVSTMDYTYGVIQSVKV